MREWEFENLLLWILPQSQHQRRDEDCVLLRKVGVRAGIAVAEHLHTLWPPSSTGASVQPLPREAEPRGEEDMGKRQAEAARTRRELGDVNKSGVQGGPRVDGGNGQNGFLRLFPHLGFHQTTG